MLQSRPDSSSNFSLCMLVLVPSFVRVPAVVSTNKRLTFPLPKYDGASQAAMILLHINTITSNITWRLRLISAISCRRHNVIKQSSIGHPLRSLHLLRRSGRSASNCCSQSFLVLCLQGPPYETAKTRFSRPDSPIP